MAVVTFVGLMLVAMMIRPDFQVPTQVSWICFFMAAWAMIYDIITLCKSK